VTWIKNVKKNVYYIYGTYCTCTCLCVCLSVVSRSYRRRVSTKRQLRLADPADDASGTAAWQSSTDPAPRCCASTRTRPARLAAPASRDPWRHGVTWPVTSHGHLPARINKDSAYFAELFRELKSHAAAAVTSQQQQQQHSSAHAHVVAAWARKPPVRSTVIDNEFQPWIGRVVIYVWPEIQNVTHLRTRLDDRSFAVAGPRVWNCLPAEVEC